MAKIPLLTGQSLMERIRQVRVSCNTTGGGGRERYRDNGIFKFQEVEVVEDAE